MENLNRYFDLFDQSRTSEQAFEELVGLFSEDIVFVLNGHEKQGIENWKLFVKMVFKENADIKHMFEGWKAVEGTDKFQTGKDIAKLDDNGKISYLENVPDDTNMFDTYKN
jgi:hypothetical protein